MPPAHSGANFTFTLHDDIYPATDPTKSDLSQLSKVVLITGSGRGIGRSIALRYAECQVACIIICSRTISELDEVESSIRKLNSTVKVHKLTVDVTNNSQVLAAIETVKKEEGRLDILVNNAGATSLWVPLADGEPEDYWKTWEINMKGTYLMLHASLPLMVETAKAHGTVNIVITTSIGALVRIPGASAYQISKLALLRLGEFVVDEYGDKGVNCFSVHPGAVLTDMAKDIDAIRPCKYIVLNAALWIYLTRDLDLTDSPNLCAGFMVWLTKGNRSWLNGRYLSSTWDVEELEAKRNEIVEGDKLKVRMVV